jgi:hypothetical protein
VIRKIDNLTSELGLSATEMEELLEGSEEGLLGRLIRLNQATRSGHPLNVVVLFQPLLDHYRAVRRGNHCATSSSFFTTSSESPFGPGSY